MISVKEATKVANACLKDLLSSVKLHGIRLEEVELGDDDEFWNITLSYVDPDVDMPAVYPTPREYKRFKVRRQGDHAGEVVAMTIRELG